MRAAPFLRLLLLPPFAWGLLAGPPGTESCPRSLDCTLQRREFCLPGSFTCGPCLPQFVEDGHGKCISKRRAANGQAAVPNLEEEIDLVADALSKQDGAHLRLLQDGMIVVCTAAGIAALVVAAICWCRLQREIRLARKADYPAHKPQDGPPSYDKISPGDKKLAQSAQMYHYQHQKQQMLSMEKHKEEAKVPESASSDEENEDGDFTVYECPGLAPTGEMEVKNPLFDDSSLHPPPHQLHP